MKKDNNNFIKQEQDVYFSKYPFRTPKWNIIAIISASVFLILLVVLFTRLAPAFAILSVSAEPTLPTSEL